MQKRLFSCLDVLKLHIFDFICPVSQNYILSFVKAVSFGRPGLGCVENLETPIPEIDFLPDS